MVFFSLYQSLQHPNAYANITSFPSIGCSLVILCNDVRVPDPVPYKLSMNQINGSMTKMHQAYLLCSGSDYVAEVCTKWLRVNSSTKASSAADTVFSGDHYISLITVALVIRALVISWDHIFFCQSLWDVFSCSCSTAAVAVVAAFDVAAVVMGMEMEDSK